MGRRKFTEQELENRKELGKYLPTQAEIAEACAEIRKEWSPQVEAGRRAPERLVDMGIIHHVVHDDDG